MCAEDNRNNSSNTGWQASVRRSSTVSFISSIRAVPNKKMLLATLRTTVQSRKMRLVRQKSTSSSGMFSTVVPLNTAPPLNASPSTAVFLPVPTSAIWGGGGVDSIYLKSLHVYHYMNPWPFTPSPLDRHC